MKILGGGKLRWKSDTVGGCATTFSLLFTYGNSEMARAEREICSRCASMRDMMASEAPRVFHRDLGANITSGNVGSNRP